MTPTDLLQQLQAWTEGGLSAAQTQQFLGDFLDQPIWFPGTRQTLPAHPGKSIHRLHLVPNPHVGLPTLPAWFDDPATLDDPPDTDALLHYPASSLLVFAMKQRFHLRLQHRGRQGLLAYDDLLNLRTLTLLRRLGHGEAVDPTPLPDLSPLVPLLRDHARTHPALRRVWLAVVSSAVGHQALAVVSAAADAQRQLDAVDRLLGMRLPAGVMLNVVEAAAAEGPGANELQRLVQRFKPLHDADAGLGRRWLARLRHRLWRGSAVPVVVLDIDGAKPEAVRNTQTRIGSPAP
jgi:hypothetical protein